MIQEYQLWELLVPDEIHKTSEWLSGLKSTGVTLWRQTKGYWANEQEDVMVVRIACDETMMIDIMKYTLEFYNQDAVMAYKISNCCLMYYRD